MNTATRSFSVKALGTYGLFLVLFYVGCLCCFLLQAHAGFSPILSASLLGVAITFIPLPSHIDPKPLQLAFCAGSFIGMGSSQIIANPLQLLLVSLLGGVIYLLAKPHFSGIGGKMGAIAFVATAAWVLLGVLV